MKSIILVLLFISPVFSLKAEDINIHKDSVYTVITYNGGEFTGKIIKRDSKELIINTEDRGEITIPMYEIEEIVLMGEKRKSTLSTYEKRYEKFAKHYIYTKNAHSLPKGENYIVFNFFGPDIQFGVTDNFDMGVMTTWYAMPVLFRANYTIPVSEKFRIGLGGNLGLLSWIDLSQGQLVVPYASFTFGGIENNFNISVGYPGVTYDEYYAGNYFFSIGGQRRMSDNWSFVIESMFLPIDDVFSGVIMPSFRFYTSGNNAWQFGFAAGSFDGNVTGLPLAAIQYMWNM